MLDIIVPVYDQRGFVDTCLNRAIATVDPARHELIVIDDASRDADLRRSLAARAASGTITLLTNARNCGFTQTVNRGMRVHPDRDVILLNSDTEVYGNWIDRLEAAV